MTTISNVFSAEIRSSKDQVEGKVLTRPALLYTDGINVTYAVDVDIGQEGKINANGDIGILPLKNVPIAANNGELRYAEIGQAVNLTKNDLGHWEVTGLSKTLPGTFTMVPVTLPDYCLGIPVPVIGDPTELGIEVRILTYDELATYGLYGEVPYGAVAVFENGILTEIRSS
ncbi:MAG: hypothetical protein U9Q19_02695 [Pseudomonadota bacterium]|nr:hypothetical protein [Pseudomonadota bacterium]